LPLGGLGFSVTRTLGLQSVTPARRMAENLRLAYLKGLRNLEVFNESIMFVSRKAAGNRRPKFLYCLLMGKQRLISLNTMAGRQLRMRKSFWYFLLKYITTVGILTIIHPVWIILDSSASMRYAVTEYWKNANRVDNVTLIQWRCIGL